MNSPSRDHAPTAGAAAVDTPPRSPVGDELPWVVEVSMGSIGWGQTQTLFYATREDAEAKYADVDKAFRIWQGRNNEREQVIEVADELGRLSIDLMHVASVRVWNRAKLDDWNLRRAREERRLLTDGAPTRQDETAGDTPGMNT